MSHAVILGFSPRGQVGRSRISSLMTAGPSPAPLNAMSCRVVADREAVGRPISDRGKCRHVRPIVEAPHQLNRTPQKLVREFAHKRIGERAMFLGTRNDVRGLHPDLDVAVHPSHSENVGGAAESLLNGVPTVASSVGSFSGIVKSEETGWLVPPKRPVSIANAIREVLLDRHNALAIAEEGPALCSNLLDVRRTAAEVPAIYETILGSES